MELLHDFDAECFRGSGGGRRVLPGPSGSAAVLGTHNQKVNFGSISKYDVDNLIILIQVIES